MEKIFIIDAVNYLFRSYYAIGPMTNDAGLSTSALFGFIRSVQKLLKEFNPKYAVAVFDGPNNKKARKAVYAEYKMQRKKAPDDLYPQFDLAFEFCSLFGLSALSIPEVEADDTMATIALWAQKNHLETYLCTSDKDLFQLVSDHLFVLLSHKDNLIVDAKKVEELFGVKPEQIVDFLAIAGDSSDNIPGLSGFGPKTAASLLQEFKTLDYLLEHPEKVPGAQKQRTLIKEKETALISRTLALLNTHVEIPQEKEFFKLKEPKISELEAFFAKMNFSKLLKELKTSSQMELPLDISEEARRTQPAEPQEKTDYRLIQNLPELKKLIDELLEEKEICLDLETTSLKPLEAKIVGLGLGFKPKKAFYLPFNGNLETAVLLKELKRLFSSSGPAFYGHNIKYDLQVLLNYGLEIRKLAFDTLLASYLIAPHHRRHNLDQLALEYFGKTKIPFESLTAKNQTLLQAPIENVSAYCSEDVDYTVRLKQLFAQTLKEKKLGPLLEEIELPLVFVLAKMERHGVFLDAKKLKPLQETLTDQLHLLEKQIHQETGEEFNLNSPKQLSEVLFQKLKLPLPRRRRTEYSTGADVLENLAEKFPLVQKILNFRATQKLLTTYVEALPLEINPETKRIHPTFSQSTAATGRLSCQNPNLQNIPVKSEEGLQIRKAFKPEHPGWSLLSADYSQIELRLLAHFSEDPKLVQAFQEDKDIHAYTASLVFKVPLEEVTEKMRQTAKAVNFGTLYGQGAFGLQQQLKISYKEAGEFIKNYFERYEKVREYIEECHKKAAENQETQTLFSRKRPLPEISSKNPQIKAAAERLAVNTPLQGTAADLIKIAMIRIDQKIEKQKLEGFMILQIHDELVFEVPDKELETFKTLVKDEMENVVKLKVPLTVHLGVGKNWGEC
ncbi:MAG: DNA polymerase I [Parachlamydiales bacterium]